MKYIYNLFLFSFAVFFTSCDIEERILDEALGNDLIGNASGENLLAPAYNALRDAYGHRSYFALQTYASDEGMLPTRINDWFDGGTFQDLHKHSWAPTHQYTSNTWNELTGGIASSLQAIVFLDDGSQLEAEAIGLLSYQMYVTLDLFGQVPYRDITDINFNNAPQILTGIDALNVIETNINSVMSKLGSGQNSVRFGQDAAKALLARMYMNKAVYADRYGSFTFSNADMQKVIDLTTELINGPYALETQDYFKLFDPTNENHSEIIFAVKNELTSPSIGGQSVTRNSTNGMSRGYFLTPSRSVKGSDAGCTLPGFLDTWDSANDPRFAKENYAREEGAIPLADYVISRGFQEGQQYGAKIVDGKFSYDGNGLLEITALRSTRDQSLANHSRAVNLVAVNQSTGVRVIKWGIDTTNDNRNDSGVDIPIFRLADIYLMRAEAKYRMGADGLSDINAVREARKTGFGLTTATLNDVYLERGFEFYWEYHRRTDQIRFGKWEDNWQDKSSTDVNKRVYPIPPASIAVTEGLIQNQGY